MNSQSNKSHSEYTTRAVIDFALSNLPNFAFVHYVGILDKNLLKALDNTIGAGDGFIGMIQVSGFYKDITDPEIYPAIRFICGEGSVGADLLIMDTAWTPSYRIESVTERIPPRLIVLIDDAINDALIDKYEWRVVDNIAFGKLKDPDGKWIGDLKPARSTGN